MERKFINSNFKYVHVIPMHNGISWSTEQLCRKIVSDYKAFNFNGNVFVWIDREGRPEAAETIRVAIINALQNAGAICENIHVMINDRMAENVILADELIIQEELKYPTYQYNHEGANGKFALKAIFKERGIFYKEMVEGVRLLNKIRLERAALKSPAVQSFLSTFDAPCWWR